MSSSIYRLHLLSYALASTAESVLSAAQAGVSSSCLNVQVKATKKEAAALEEARQAEGAAAYAAAAEARELQSLLDQVNQQLSQERCVPSFPSATYSVCVATPGQS